MKIRLRPALALATLLSVLGASAHGQYVWLDERGRKQYSDMPPPASVPDKRILKQPGMRTATGPATQPAAAAGEQTNAPGPTLAERDAEFRKRRAEKAEQEKKAQEEARVAAENRKRCDWLREYHSSLKSGERLARRTASGEREFLSDEDRKRELKEAKRMLAECK